MEILYQFSFCIEQKSIELPMFKQSSPWFPPQCEILIKISVQNPSASILTILEKFATVF